ncbi:glycosyltransferase family 4 protein [Paenibacillus illinoisensis]|uniref:glycosyltransferase family 4 protein n=1 Tax=Paenibacillus illinoisensis TaxID=59845 RepID=UPI003A4D50A2
MVKGEGQGRVNYEVVVESLKQGHEVIMISNEVDRELLENRNATWIKVFPSLKLPQLLRYQIFAFESAAHIRKLRKEKRVDLVMVNGFITWAKGDINAVHFVHSTWIKSPVHSFRVHRSLKRWYFGMYTLINAYLERHAFRTSGKIIAVSEKVKRELVKLGIHQDKVQVINNGVDVREFYPSEPANKTKMDLGPNQIVGLFAGDIGNPRKNLDTVLKSMVSVPELSLVVAGSTQGSIYPQMAKDLEIEDRIHFLGYRKDMGHIMRNVDLFIFPSRYEACSLVVLEALASGIPVVITEESGVTEIIEGANGNVPPGVVLDDPNDITNLTNVLNDLIQDPSHLAEMGQSSRKVALLNDWRKMSLKYIESYEDYLNKTGSITTGLKRKQSIEVEL